ncbi:hypothetical protein Tco_0783206 [Tanacetum coccineum]
MSFDDLYNNFKIVEQEVKGTASSSSSSQNMAFVSSPSCTNEVNTASTQVSPASTQVSTATMLAIDGAGFDWSYMADDEVPTNVALMAFLDSEVHTDKTCSKTCLKSFETLKTQLDVVPPPPTGLFLPPTLDWSNSGLKEFQQPEFEGYGPKYSKSVSEDISNEVRESPDAPLVEELVSDDKLEKKTIFPTITKIEFVRPKQQENPVRKPVKYAEMYRSQGPRGNQRNWNNQKSQKLGSDFVMYNKACFVCGSFDHVRVDCNYHQRERVVLGIILQG